jgi:hypothetical protein
LLDLAEAVSTKHAILEHLRLRRVAAAAIPAALIAAT